MNQHHQANKEEETSAMVASSCYTLSRKLTDGKWLERQPLNFRKQKLSGPPHLTAAQECHDFFSVRRLLGSRQVVTQCLCQLNELCSILHCLLFGSVKREHGPLHSPNIAMRWRPHEAKPQNKQTKTTKAFFLLQRLNSSR